jgi:polyphosphate kinase
VHANDKHRARLNLIRDLLLRLDYKGRDERLLKVDRTIIFPYDEGYVANGMISP